MSVWIFKEPYQISLILLMVVCMLLFICTALMIGLEGRRVIVNCATFSSSDDATRFATAHTQYAKRLNPLHKVKACTSHVY